MRKIAEGAMLAVLMMSTALATAPPAHAKGRRDPNHVARAAVARRPVRRSRRRRKFGHGDVVIEHHAPPHRKPKQHKPKQAAAKQPASTSTPVCPAGVPAQTITVVNQAGISPSDLITVERAVTDQSLQLRAAWGTPCLDFGPNGWVVTMGTDERVQPDGTVSFLVDGQHFWNGQPSATVNAGGLPLSVWARGFSHEAIEMTVDPTLATRWQLPNGIGGQLEVCDPVENWTYTLDGVQVSDFALPSYFNGGAGPWDQAGALTAPVS